MPIAIVWRRSPRKRIRTARPSLGAWLRCAYLRFLIRHAEDDLSHLEREAITLPARTAGHRRHIDALRAELALEEKGAP